MDEYETSVSLIRSPLVDPVTSHLVFPPPELYMMVVRTTDYFYIQMCNSMET